MMLSMAKNIFLAEQKTRPIRMNIPANLKYTKEHEWVRLEDGIATVGITDHAQDALGDVVFVELAASAKGPRAVSFSK